jgi:ribosomal protein S18 acetylase RimI-like enzyme
MPYTVVSLSAGRDVVRLQRLLERCSDYYELHEGWPTPLDAGEYELTPIPGVVAAEDFMVIALEEGNDGALNAFLQILKNAPERGTWWIGLLVVAPELRSRGVGAELLQHGLAAAAEEGVTTVKLAVSVHNPRGLRFWQRAGFVDTEKTCEVAARSGHVDTGRIMVRVQ